MDPVAILFATVMVVTFLTLIAVSSKTGYVMYSMQSYLRENQPRFEVDKTKISIFVAMVAIVFLFSTAFGLILLHDIQELGGVLLCSLMITAIVAYGLSFWVLLKEKKPGRKN